MTSESECARVGCCFDASNSPNCFLASAAQFIYNAERSCDVSASDRQLCGYDGVSADDCLNYGCCYFPNSGSAHWCYRAVCKSRIVTIITAKRYC